MLNAGQTFGHYQIVEKLGEGGMGVVFKARDKRLNRLVALKLLSQEKVGDENQLRRFALEAHAASTLNHPNIVTIYDISSEGGTQYIAMEYVPGKTLDQVIPRRGMRLSEALQIAIQIAEAVDAASSAGIIHRDLKPGNIMVTDSGQVKVVDFGLAKVFGTGSEDETMAFAAYDPRPRTREGTMVGTVAYMSPEQAEGKPLDTRSDIFSFGTVLYEIITGQQAFRGDTGISTIMAILRDEPPPASQVVPDVPHELETIINRCLRKDPGRRFQTIADVRISLSDLKEDSDSGKLSVISTLKPGGGHRFRSKAWILVSVLAGASILAAVLWTFHSTPVNLPPPHVTPFASYSGFEGYPAFSPDGNEVAFAWTGGTGEITHIFVKVIGTDDYLPLTSGELSDSHPAFAPDGRSVAFLRNLKGSTGIFLVSPLGGRPRKVNEIAPSLYQSLAWSRDGKWLVTSSRSEKNDHSRLLLVSVADGHYRALSFDKTRDEFGPSLSPDSRSLTFVRAQSYSDWDLFVVPVDENVQPTGAAFRLNTPTGLNRQPAWTANGKEVVFANGGTSTTRLWRVSANNKKPAEVITAAGEAVYHPAIAAVGNRLAFAHDFNNSNIWTIGVTANGKAAERKLLISSARSSYVRPNALSSDGRKIAFESNRSGYYGIWTANADGSGASILFENGVVNSGSPAWSADGQQLAFDTRIGKNGQVLLISADGGPPHALTHGDSDNILPKWSHDGKWIYFDSNRTGRFEIFKCSPSGGNPVQVTFGGGWGVQESPDGRQLYYTRRRAVSTPLLVMPVEGGPESEVLPSVHERWWAVTDKGIWLLEREGHEQDPGLWSMESAVSDRANLRFFNFARHHTVTVTGIAKSPAGGLALSPDGHRIYWSQVDHQAYEIALLENFQ